MASVRTTVFLVLALASVALTSCGAGEPPAPSAEGRIRIGTDVGDLSFEVEIAESESARERGLMERTSLEEGTGMVFLFDGPTEGRFWMKDTLIPLSIAFWDAEGSIVAILDMEPCESDPCQTYGPDRPYVGALEVSRGALADAGIGDRVTLERD